MKEETKTHAMKGLWRRIEAVAFDEEVAFAFSDRLMRDNGWTRDFTERAIEEYRRFAYLAVTCDHEVTPSDEVDQVWHLHLLYTRHYWGVWKEALGGPLHHGPTRGGEADASRFEGNYARTLAAYEAAFGEKAPDDLWPPAHVRFTAPLRVRRVDTGRYFLLSRQLLARWITTFAALVGATTLATLAHAHEAYFLGIHHKGWETMAIFTIIVVVVGVVAYSAITGKWGKGGSGCSSGCSSGCGSGCGGCS